LFIIVMILRGRYDIIIKTQELNANAYIHQPQLYTFVVITFT
jgi:hypothetical protein